MNSRKNSIDGANKVTKENAENDSQTNGKRLKIPKSNELMKSNVKLKRSAVKVAKKQTISPSKSPSTTKPISAPNEKIGPRKVHKTKSSAKHPLKPKSLTATKKKKDPFNDTISPSNLPPSDDKNEKPKIESPTAENDANAAVGRHKNSDAKPEEFASEKKAKLKTTRFPNKSSRPKRAPLTAANLLELQLGLAKREEVRV